MSGGGEGVGQIPQWAASAGFVPKPYEGDDPQLKAMNQDMVEIEGKFYIATQIDEGSVTFREAKGDIVIKLENPEVHAPQLQAVESSKVIMMWEMPAGLFSAMVVLRIDLTDQKQQMTMMLGDLIVAHMEAAFEEAKFQGEAEKDKAARMVEQAWMKFGFAVLGAAISAGTAGYGVRKQQQAMDKKQQALDEKAGYIKDNHGNYVTNSDGTRATQQGDPIEAKRMENEADMDMAIGQAIVQQAGMMGQLSNQFGEALSTTIFQTQIAEIEAAKLLSQAIQAAFNDSKAKFAEIMKEQDFDNLQNQIQQLLAVSTQSGFRG